MQSTENQTVRVCAYARVSTKDKEQLSSLENQISYFRREFGNGKDPNSRFPNYELVQLYADCGKSGTSLRRPDFDRMISDAGIDKDHVDGDLFRIKGEPLFSRIIVKNTSRFARNVSSDMLLKTLTKNGVYVDFIDTSLSTEHAPDIMTLQILQVLDEHESRDKSRKVLFGIEETIRKGQIQTSGSLYGYRYLPKPDNRLEIIPEEAAVIRTIFDLYANEGYGAYRIAKHLTMQGLLTRKGRAWNQNTILGMLRNEAYTGRAVRHKYTGGHIFDSDYAKKSDTPLVFESERIPRIVEDDVFYMANRLMDSRISVQNKGINPPRNYTPSKPIGGNSS